MKFNVTVSKHVYHAWSESDMEEKKDLENMGFRIEKGKASNDHYYLDPNTPPIIVDLTTMEDSNLEFSDLMNELYLVKLAKDHFVVYTADRVGSQADRNLGFAQISLVRNERLAEITVDNGEISIKALD